MEQKIDLFTYIHKGVRAMLYDTGRQLQLADLGNEQEMLEMLNRLELTLEMLEEHAVHEDHYIFPLVEAAAPGATHESEHEHRAYEEKVLELQALIHKLRETPIPEERQAQSSTLNRCYTDFLAFQLVHMNHEEEQVLPASQEYLTTDALMAIRGRIQGSMDAVRYRKWVYWMLSSMSIAELGSIFNQLKEAPAHVSQMFKEEGEKAIAADRWQKLCALTGITEGSSGKDDLQGVKPPYS